MVPNWLMAMPDIPPTAKLIYGRLVQFSDDGGAAWPSVETLAEAVGVSEPQVKRMVARLIKERLIAVKRRGAGKTNMYVFLWHDAITEYSGITYDPSMVSLMIPRRDHIRSHREITNDPSLYIRNDKEYDKKLYKGVDIVFDPFEETQEEPEKPETPPTVKRFTAPSVEECRDYAAELGIGRAEGERYHCYWDSLDWTRKTGKVKDWKAGMRYWKLNMQKPRTETTARKGADMQPFGFKTVGLKDL